MAKAYSNTRIPVPAKPQGKPKAFSYLRFSTADQEQGDSIRRQLAVTHAYARDLGLELDEELRFQDKGVSAFRGKNAAEGELALFLEHVQAGKVPAGSWLLVESLDRISRDEILDALGVLTSIIRKGITVATVSNRQVFSKENVTANPMLLMMAIMGFATAHEESKKKSFRTQENWKSKRTRAAETGEAMTSRGPLWLRLNAQTNAWEPIPERVAVVQRIFEMYLSGVGSHAVAQALNAERVPVWGKTRDGGPGQVWHEGYVKRVLFSPLVIGTMQPSTWELTEEGVRVRRMLPPIPNYYPAVIDAETWKQAQALRREGGRAPRKDTPDADLRNLFSHLLKCGKCQHTASAVRKANRVTDRVYVVCNRARLKAGCEFRSVPYADLEAAFLRDFERLIAITPSGDDGIDSALASIESALEAIPERLENLTKAYSASGVQAVLDELMAVDAERERLEGERDALLWKQADTSGPVVANRIVALRNAVNAEQVDRRHVNACLRMLLSAIEVDAEQGIARLHWKHGGTSEAVFMPPGVDCRQEARRANAAKGRATLAANGIDPVIAMVKARAALAAKRAAAKAAKATNAASPEVTSASPAEAA